jgi:hypothetical protein
VRLLCTLAQLKSITKHMFVTPFARVLVKFAVVHEPANEPNVTWRTQCGYDHNVFNNAETLTLSRTEVVDASWVAMSDMTVHDIRMAIADIL